MGSEGLADSDSDEGTLERQQNEIALLEAMYPDIVRIIQPPRQGKDGLFIGAELEVELEASHTLVIDLPPNYPQSSIPEVFLSFGPDIGNESRKWLRTRLKEIINTQEPGVESIDLIVNEVRQALEETQSSSDAGALATTWNEEVDTVSTSNERFHSGTVPSSTAVNSQEQTGTRVVLWMHHLLATTKRRAIVQRSRELSLAGFSKPGYPGAVYVEGPSENVKTFVDELKVMRWQAFQQRGSEDAPISSLFLLSKGAAAGINEVEKLGDIVDGLKAAESKESGVPSFFLQCMKIK